MKVNWDTTGKRILSVHAITIDPEYKRPTSFHYFERDQWEAKDAVVEDISGDSWLCLGYYLPIGHREFP